MSDETQPLDTEATRRSRTAPRARPRTVEVPAQVGPYRTIRVLGEGGMGVVWLAHDTRLDRQVAIKAMASDMVDDPQLRARFEREARVLAGIQHPNVATLHGLEQLDGALFLVLEHLDGEGLDQRLARGPLGVEETCEVGAHVAAALAAAHARGIIHRDLKPANVRSTSSGTWKVLDFGLARPVDRSDARFAVTGEGIALGTPLYMSPEQVLGMDLDEAVDLWAFGCVLYQCLTGRRAFTGRSIGEIERAILGDAPDWSALPADVPASLELLVRGCLQKEPLHRWRSADEAGRVLRGEADPPTPRPPEERSAGRSTGELPRQLTSFVGRREERARAAELLAAGPLVTLTGPGGCGKTRLALAIGSDLRGPHAFGDGVTFVDLAPLLSPALVPGALAAALGLREVPGRDVTDQVVDHLAARRRLVILDNCEHLLRACAELVARVLAGCPSVAVLATSREALGMPGEAVLPVPPLAVPDARAADGVEPAALLQWESVRLFVERARAARPDFALDARTSAAVAHLCRRLDGIPLALELAAARLKVLSIEQVLERLRDRFRLLAGGSQVGVPRQQTLRATIDWSHEQLAPDERAVFRRLGVFAGGATLEAAEAACAGGSVASDEVLDHLARLADKSLLHVAVEAGEARYRYLESIRQYALEKLDEAGETSDLRDRHAAICVALAERLVPRIDREGDPERVLARLDRDDENFRAAWHWTRAQSGEHGPLALRLAGALGRYWELRGRWQEGSAVLAEALELAPPDDPSVAPGDDPLLAPRLAAHEWASWLAYRRGELARALELGRTALPLARRDGTPQRIATVLNMLALASQRLGRREDAEAAHAESLRLFEEAGDVKGVALSLSNVGTIVLAAGNLARARDLFERSLAARRRLGDRRGTASSLVNLAAVLTRQGALAEAQPLLAEALDLSRGLGDSNLHASILTNLAAIETELGDLDAARDHLGESARLFESLEASSALARAETNLASLSALRGDMAEALRHVERALSVARTHEDLTALAEAAVQGAVLRLAAGEDATAERLLREALAAAEALGASWQPSELLETCARLALDRGAAPLARRLLDAALGARAATGLDAPRHLRPQLDELERRVREAAPAPPEPVDATTAIALAKAWLG